MRESDIVRTVRIKHEATGTEATKAAVNSVTDAVKNLGNAAQVTGVQQETATRRQASAAAAFERLERRVNPAARALAELEQAQRLVGRAVDQNAALQERGAAVLQIYRDRVTAAGAAHGEISKGAGLARHELINLSRQVQDVGVSLASGQSPLMVAVQQGSQIADVFAASSVSVRGFFTQAIGWAGRFATSAAGVATAIATIGVASVASMAQFSSASREIDKVLSTAGGAASGIGRGGINRIADQGSSVFGLSVSEAREAATAFAATGKIYEQSAERATLITKQFAIAMGVDVAEASKKLAQDLQSPGAAASEWAKRLTGINADTVAYIRNLENMGDRQGAINALITAAAPGLAKQAEQVGTLSKAWDAVSNSVSNVFEWYGRTTAKNLERFTGRDFGGFSDEERLDRLKGTQSELLNSRTPGLDAAALKQVTAAVEELEQKMAALREQTENQRFANLSNEVDGFARSVNATETQIERLSAALVKLQEYQAQREARGLAADPGADEATRRIQDQVAALIEADQAEKNRSRAVAETVMRYRDVGSATAMALSSLEDQLTVAQQLSGAARMQAEAQATFNSLLAQGKTEYEAMQIAAAQLDVNQANISTSIQKQVESLNDQTRLMRASEGSDRARVAASIAYKNAIADGADEVDAAALRAATFANEMERASKAARNVGSAMKQAAKDFDNMMSKQLDFSELSAYESAGGHRPDTVSSGDYSFLSNNTFGDKKFEGILSNVGFAFAQAANRAASSQEVIAGALSGGVNSALTTLQGTQFQSTLRNPFGAPFEINNARSGFGSQADITGAIEQLYQLKLAQAGDDTAARRAVYEDQLAFLMTQPQTIQTQLAIANLQNTMRQLTDAVEANTAAQVTLNPFYTQGHGALPQFGFYHAANGLDLTAYGPSGGDQIPFSAMVNGGENIKITPAGAASNDNSKTINNYTTFNFGGGKSSDKRRSLRQVAAGYDQAMAASA